MRSLNLYGNVDAAICALDSLNHLESIDDVKKVFKRVHLFCEPKGLFIFDINTEFKHKSILGEHTFIYKVYFFRFQISYSSQCLAYPGNYLRQ